MAESADDLVVEAAYATCACQTVIELRVAPGTSVRDVIEASGLLEQYPEIDIESASVGIFGRMASLVTRVNEGDRVEIYRPLQIDPKAARRQRANTSGSTRAS